MADDFSMTATKSMTYMTRRLKAGDDFTAKSRRERAILMAAKKARPATGTKAEAIEAKEEAELSALRSEYTDKLGKRPYHGWDAETLREKMADSD